MCKTFKKYHKVLDCVFEQLYLRHKAVYQTLADLKLKLQTVSVAAPETYNNKISPHWAALCWICCISINCEHSTVQANVH